MSNMSYCQFENTNADLRQCEEWLRDNNPTTMSDIEQEAFRLLVRRCRRIAEDYEDVK